MVLHNSKWDKRAKTRYLKKHGLNANPGTHPENSPPSNEDTSQEFENTEPANLSIDGTPDMGEIVALPEFDDDDTDKIRKKAALIAQERLASQQQQKQPLKPTDSTIFKQAEANYERSKINESVRKHIGRQAKPVELDSDSDFEEFMDKLSDDEVETLPSNTLAKENVTIGTEQQKFVDNLLF